MSAFAFFFVVNSMSIPQKLMSFPDITQQKERRGPGSGAKGQGFPGAAERKARSGFWSKRARLSGRSRKKGVVRVLERKSKAFRAGW